MDQIIALQRHAAEHTVARGEDVAAARLGVGKAVLSAVADLFRCAGLQVGAVHVTAQGDPVAVALFDLVAGGISQ